MRKSLLTLFALAFAATASAEVTARDAFARLKTLDGAWEGGIIGQKSDPVAVTYRVTSGGHTVMESLFAGAPHEMVTMYTVDGDDVIATHYCSGGNQPMMKLDRAASTADELIFTFSSVRGDTSKGGYINGVRYRFDADGKVFTTWSSSGEGPHLKTVQTRKK